MTRTVYVNGRYLPEAEATVSVFDRAFLFGDGVYEVTAVLDGKMVDFDAHMARLRRSLGELSIGSVPGEPELREIHARMIELNGLREGAIYLQITRGVADRNFLLPAPETKPTVVVFTQAYGIANNPLALRGLRVMTLPDLRWQRRDIKTVQLVYPSLAKTQAVAAGYDDAWLVEDGMVTEGSSSNAHILTADNRIVTRPLSNAILPGITRAAMLMLAARENLQIEERAFSVDEVKAATEAFITSATSFVLPVVEIDGQAIGAGRPGPVSSRLRGLYVDAARRVAGAGGSSS